MEYTFDASVDLWKPESSIKMQQDESSDSAYFTPTASSSSTMSAAVSDTNASALSIPHKNAPLNERFEYIMSHVEAAGFESFDSMASAYYTETFEESSSLADEQRLSRNRRLPHVISDVYNATNQWTDWERKGFQEQIFKIAESMLSFEGCSARHQLATDVNSLVEAQDTGNLASEAEALLSIKRTVQEKVRTM